MSSTSSNNSLQVAAISAAAGLAAGALVAVVLWRYQAAAAGDADDRRTSARKADKKDSLRSGSVASGRSNVPLFDSVQGWLRTQSSTSPNNSGLVSRRSGRSGTMSGRPPPVLEVPEVDEENAEGGSHQAGAARDLPLSDWEIQESDIEICKRSDGSLWHLGAGSYGQVFKALRGGVQPVAVKVFPSDATDVQMADFQKEVVILRSCRDRNIVQFLGACITDTQTCLVTEYMEGGDLFNALHRDHKGNLTWYKRGADARPIHPPEPGLGKRIALDIARGLHFLHTHRIVHMDIKSPNVLLGGNYVAKLADVGLAKFLHKTFLSAAKSVGTFAWSAPEVLMGGRCSEKVDIFSLGVVLWELVTGESPARGRLRPVKVPSECPESVVDLIAACMEPDPADRPSAREIVDMLSQVADKPLTSRSSRRQRSGGELGASSGKVLDDIIRHANVLGMHDFTRADALLSAEYKDEFRLYNTYVAELRRAWGDGEDPPPKDSRQRARILELVASFRQLLSYFLAEDTDCSRDLRNVDLHKSKGREQDKPAVAVAQKNGESVVGKREAAVDWGPALKAMKLTPEQAAAVVDARVTVTIKIEELTKQRRELITALQNLALGGTDDGYGSAVEKTDELRRNMAQEGSLMHEFHFWLFCTMLKPEQEAVTEITAFPFFPDANGISELLVKDAVHARSNAKHSAEQSE